MFFVTNKWKNTLTRIHQKVALIDGCPCSLATKITVYGFPYTVILSEFFEKWYFPEKACGKSSYDYHSSIQDSSVF